MNLAWLFLSTEGRIPRRWWWLGVLATLLPILPLAALDWKAADIAVSLLLLYPQYALDAKRLHDRGFGTRVALIPAGLAALMILDDLLGWFARLPQPFWSLAVALLLVIGLWFLVELGVRRGVEGGNEHGPDPLDRPR